MSNHLPLLKLCLAVRELWGSSPLVDPNSFTENIFDTKLSIQVFTMKLLMQASGRKVLGFESKLYKFRFNTVLDNSELDI